MSTAADRLEDEREAHQACVEMLNEAEAEIERLRAIIAWLDDNEPTLMSMVRERLANEQNGNTADE